MEDIMTAIQTLTLEFVEKIGFAATVEVTPEGESYRVHIKTEEDASMLIGKHAHMLAALQRLIGAMLFKRMGEKVDVLIDVNDYRDAQKERIIGIADNIARRVIDEDRPSHVSSFSAYERKIIHEHISNNYHSLESHSEGEGKFRQLVIARKTTE
jgi:spoIIIJ-associated protein